MKIYLFYSPAIIIVVFIYLIIKWLKIQKEFKKKVGINTFLPFADYKLLADNYKTENELVAYKKLKHESIKLFKIWVAALLVYIFITIIVGVTTATK